MKFGFSAFLKLVHLKESQQRAQLRRRFSESGGYDFHKSLRSRIGLHLNSGVPLAQIIAELDSVKPVPERRSVRLGLQSFSQWREANPSPIISCSSALFESSQKSFQIEFKPDFCIEQRGKRLAVHVWNTAKPELVPRLVFSVLSQVHQAYSAEAPDQVAVLCLPTR